MRRSVVLWSIRNRLYSQKRCFGHIDRYMDGRIEGWAARFGTRDAVLIDLRADGNLIVQAAKAETFRDDLKSAGIGRGQHAFSLEVGNLDVGCRIELLESGSEEVLASLVVEPRVVNGTARQTVDSMIAVLTPQFDIAHYLEQFDGAVPTDPVRHYIEQGWVEGLDPHPDFSTSHYLAVNDDVREKGLNPYWHYIVAGQAERRSPKATGGGRIARLKELRPLDQTRQKWRKREDPPPAIALEDLRADPRVSAALAASTTLVGVCHDPYHKIAGGIQLCVQLEERAMLDAGNGYLAIYPWQPLPMLAAPAEGRLLLLHVQGELVGPVRLEDLERLLQDRQSSTGLHVAVHSLLGHSPEALSSLIGKIAPETVSFWLHDHFTLCESFTLQRNSVAFCGAPTPTSPACGICIYGSGRRAHLDRIAAFFTSVTPDVIAPSRFQLDFWSARSDLPCRSATVHDLAVLGPAEDRARPSDPEGPLRIAYVGWPADHKGWGEFCELSALARKEDAEFHYFGNDTVRVQRVQVHPLHVTPDTPSEAAEALWTAGIDIVLHWASWPETFSFTTHEALAADALVVTSPDSGNVAALASRDERICVLPDKDTLFRDVLSGEIAARALRRRADRTFRRIHYAAATADVIFGRRTGR